MVKIRLSRVGTTNQPKYRVVVADEQRARNGKFLEIIGSFDPTVKSGKFELKKDRFNYWSGVGAQTTEAVAKLIKNEKAA